MKTNNDKEIYMDKDNVYGEEVDEWNECFDEDYVTIIRSDICLLV